MPETEDLPSSTHEMAVALCNASRSHSAGEGRHNATRWGPCSQHEVDVPGVRDLIARERADARAEGVREGAARVAALESALVRTEMRFRSAVNGRPVRDMDETLAENRAALAESTAPEETR